MANKCTLHRSQLQAFVAWLQLQNFAVEITEGKIDYQVLRARRDDLKRPIIVYSHNNGGHYTFDARDIPFVEAFWASDVAVNVPIQDPDNDSMPWGL
jgi:hypothetical protein